MWEGAETVFFSRKVEVSCQNRHEMPQQARKGPCRCEKVKLPFQGVETPYGASTGSYGLCTIFRTMFNVQGWRRGRGCFFGVRDEV